MAPDDHEAPVVRVSLVNCLIPPLQADELDTHQLLLEDDGRMSLGLVPSTTPLGASTLSFPQRRLSLSPEQLAPSKSGQRWFRESAEMAQVGQDAGRDGHNGQGRT